MITDRSRQRGFGRSAVLALTFPTLAAAQTPEWFDLKPGSELESGAGLFFLDTEQSTYLRQGERGLRTDGTSAGTTNFLVPSFSFFAPGGDSTLAGWIELDDGRLVFGGGGTLSQAELIVTDGTTAGTSVLSDVNPYLGAHGPIFAKVRGEVWFRGWTSTLGHELWRTDGSAPGTFPLFDGTPGAEGFLEEGAVASAGGQAYLFTGLGTQPRLWTTDGTSAGTQLVSAIAPFAQSSTRLQVGELNGRLLFLIEGLQDESGLYVSDGTASGTVRLFAKSDAANMDLEIADNRAFLRPADSALPSQAPGQLVSTEGTAASTVVINVDQLRREGSHAGDQLIFQTSNGLFSWDGISSNPSAISALTGATSFRSRGGLAYFQSFDSPSGNWELYFTDGTSAGTIALPPAATPQEFSDYGVSPGGPVRGDIESLGLASTTQLDLIRYDASTSNWGAIGAAGIEQALGSSSYGFARLQAKAIFGAVLNIADYTLYSTTGNEAELEAFATGSVLPAGAPSLSPGDVVNYAGKAWYLAGDSLVGTDGTTAGTVTIGVPQPFSLTRIGDRLLIGSNVGFFAPQVESRFYLSDGSQAGTVPVTDPNAPLILGPAVPFGDVAIFTGASVGSSADVWVTDGTAAGTERLVDLPSGVAGMSPGGYTVAGDLFYFGAGGTFLDNFAERNLYVSDGTTAGSFQLTDQAGAEIDDVGSTQLEALGDRMAFTRLGSADEEDLWITDGTPQGTEQLVDFPATGGQLFLEAAGDRLFFSRRILGKNLFELWVSDGTSAGTFQVATIDSVIGSSSTAALALDALGFQDRVVFRARDEAGFEPWVSDGTPAGTRRWADLNPGPASSLGGFALTNIVQVGNRVLLRAKSAEFGSEPVSLPASAVGGWAKTQLGEACAGVFGKPRIDASGDGTTGGELELRVENAFPGGLAAIFVGTDFIPAIGAGLCSAQVSAPVLLGSSAVDSEGVARLVLNVPNQVALIDRELFLQAIAAELNAPFGGFATLTGALELVIAE